MKSVTAWKRCSLECLFANPTSNSCMHTMYHPNFFSQYATGFGKTVRMGPSDKYNRRPPAKIRAKPVHVRAYWLKIGQQCPPPPQLIPRGHRDHGNVSAPSTATMSARKRPVPTSSSGLASKKAKRQVSVATFNKWKSQYERDHQAMSWLRCDIDQQDRSLVAQLWCEACRKHEGAITGMKNFSRAWITGTGNQAS